MDILKELSNGKIIQLKNTIYKLGDDNSLECKSVRSKKSKWEKCTITLGEFIKNKKHLKIYYPKYRFKNFYSDFIVKVYDDKYELQFKMLDDVVLNNCNNKIDNIHITTSKKLNYKVIPQILELPNKHYYKDKCFIPKQDIEFEFFSKLSELFNEIVFEFLDKTNLNYNGVGRPKNKVERVRIATYIDETLNKKLRIYAASNGIGLNDVLEKSLNQFFK